MQNIQYKTFLNIFQNDFFVIIIKMFSKRFKIMFWNMLYNILFDPTFKYWKTNSSNIF